MFSFRAIFLLFLSLFSTLPPTIADTDLTRVTSRANTAAVRNQAGDDPSYTDEVAFQRAMIGTHNKWRKEHGAKEVSWDKKLAEFAATHTKKCKWGHSGGPYGENLVAGYKTAQLSLDAWGNERSYYRSLADYDKQVPPAGSGHFTQMVWASTEKIGCARTKCMGVIGEDFESWYVACEYFVRGNVGGQYTRNVFKPVRKIPSVFEEDDE